MSPRWLRSSTGRPDGPSARPRPRPFPDGARAEGLEPACLELPHQRRHGFEPPGGRCGAERPGECRIDPIDAPAARPERCRCPFAREPSLLAWMIGSSVAFVQAACCTPMAARRRSHTAARPRHLSSRRAVSTSPASSARMAPSILTAGTPPSLLRAPESAPMVYCGAPWTATSAAKSGFVHSGALCRQDFPSRRSRVRDLCPAPL
jgi:hypothetical protein